MRSLVVLLALGSARGFHHMAHTCCLQPRRAQLMLSYPFADGLPIAEVLPEVVSSLRDEDANLVLEAPPGAGKTTTVPLALLQDDDGWLGDGLIMVLEPRRVAAKAAAARMASLLSQPLGEQVGYRIRHESKSGRSTRVLVVTERCIISGAEVGQIAED